MARPGKTSRKPTKAEIKAKADRAEKTAKGEDVVAAQTVIEPPTGKPGRPTLYTQELADEICTRLALGESLRAICRDDNKPDERTVREWAQDVKHPFSPHYVRARELGYLKMADELLEISDDGSNDWMEREGKDGSSYTVADHEHIARSRLRVDTRKWLLSKALPKVYGEKVTTELTGKDGGPIETKETSDIDAARRIAYALGVAMTRKNADVPPA
jgi:hypothetical protein